MVVKIPSLSSSGWTEEISEKADKLMGYFLISEASQTSLYRGNVTSLVSILRLNSDDEYSLRTDVRDSLEAFLRRYFEEVDVTVTITENMDTGKYGLDLEIEAIITEGGNRYSIGRLVSTVNASIMKIIDMNNTGN